MTGTIVLPHPVDVGDPVTPMSAVDGGFNEQNEALTATFSTAGLNPGPHTVCVVATDSSTNASAGTGDDCDQFTVDNAGGGGDTTTPTVTINQGATQVDPTNAQAVGGVDQPQGGDSGNGSGGSGSGGSDDGDVAGEFLPHTGAGTNPLAIALAGLVVVAAGGLLTRVRRRRGIRIL